MTQSSMHTLVLYVLQQVTPERLQKAVDSFVSGAYTITLASLSETEMRGFVVNGDGKEYGVVLREGQSFCSCKDAMYRKGICKHHMLFALSVIRTQQPAKSQEEKEPNLELGKTRPGFAAAY